MAGSSKKKHESKGKIVSYYTATWYDMYGKQHTGGHFKNRADAIKYGSEQENRQTSVANITFEQIFKPYMEHVLPKLSHTTNKTYNLYIENHLKKLFTVKYEKISSVDLQKFIDEIEQSRTPFVAQLCLKIAKAVCNYALKHKLINENKFLAVNNVIVPSPEKHHLTETQEKKVLNACQKLYPRYYVLLATLMGTGMRIGELIALEVTDINYENKSIKVNKQFTKGKLKDGTKNPARKIQVKEREVYITDDIVALLLEYTNSLPKGTKLLFPNKVNGYLNDKNLRIRVWKPLLDFFDITDRVRLHDLRGSYADIALQHGASIKFIQNQLGHSKAETTLNIYMKNNDDAIKKALEQMKGVFKNEEI